MSEIKQYLEGEKTLQDVKETIDGFEMKRIIRDNMPDVFMVLDSAVFIDEAFEMEIKFGSDFVGKNITFEGNSISDDTFEIELIYHGAGSNNKDIIFSKKFEKPLERQEIENFAIESFNRLSDKKFLDDLSNYGRTIQRLVIRPNRVTGSSYITENSMFNVGRNEKITLVDYNKRTEKYTIRQDDQNNEEIKVDARKFIKAIDSDLLRQV